MCEFIGLITLLTSKATFIGSVFSSLHSCVPTCTVRAEELYSATVWFAGHENQSNVCQRISLYTVGPMFSSQGKTVTPFLHCISLRQLQPHDSWHYVNWMSQRICKYKSTFFDKKKKREDAAFFRSTYSTVRNSPPNHMPTVDSNTNGNMNSFQIHIKWF